ncbi:hypothetical protein BIWAKO_06636 [Bosea sp. BIWAKO-01]|nr:hypothetical protein BIWAKO_06636 [Bosea sp. BIWAKO-01]
MHLVPQGLSTSGFLRRLGVWGGNFQRDFLKALNRPSLEIDRRVL